MQTETQPRPAAQRPPEAPPAARLTLLTFRLQGEIFALPVERVHEIIDPLPTTRVPNAPAFVPGLINVRGSVVPVVDLRHRLGMPRVEITAHSRMVVLDVEIAESTTNLALLADSVEKVIEIEAGVVEPVPEIGINLPVRYLAGIAQREADLIILLDTESLFAPDASRRARS